MRSRRRRTLHPDQRALPLQELAATALAGWLHQLTGVADPVTGRVSGWGVRDGKAMIATLRRRLIRVPARLITHARQRILRLPPGHDLLDVVLQRLQALPA
jgi:hypothetical protein